MGMAPKSQKRQRTLSLWVVVTPDERAVIKERADDSRLSVSAYLRRLGLGHTPKSLIDKRAVLDVARVSADQGRLGGLLKLWLTERPGQGASASDVRRLLHQIEETQAALGRLADRL